MSQPRQPRIQVSSTAETDGIQLLSWAHPLFDLAFKGGRADGYGPVLPYTGVIENNTEEPIMAFSVIWYSWYTDGSMRRPARSVNGFSGLGKPVVAAHSTQVVSLITALEADASRWSPSIGAAVDSLVGSFSRDVVDLNIVLDAAAFRDGGFVGADNEKWSQRWRANIDAEREVFTAVTEASEADRASVLQGLAAPGLTRARVFTGGRPSPHFSEFGVRADRADSYEECLDFERAYFALAVLDELGQGRADTMDKIRSALRSKVYPVIRKRKEREK